MSSRERRLWHDFWIIVGGIFIAIILIQFGVIKFFLETFSQFKIIGSLLAGIFFTSLFSVAISTVVIGEMALQFNPFLIAFVGAFGALIGDMIILSFFKERLSQDIRFLISRKRESRLHHIFRMQIFRWLGPFFGALIIASPLPDELGLALMGFSRTSLKYIIPISFTMNFFGILVVGLTARAIF